MRKFIFCLIAFLVPVAFLLNAQPLKISVKKGQQYKVETISHMTGNVSVMGMEQETIYESRSISVFEIKDVDKHTIELNSTLTYTSFSSKFGDIESTYDSDKKDDSPIAEKMKDKIGKTIHMVINEKGNITRQDKLEDQNGDLAVFGLMNSRPVTYLFIPELVGKEFKPGASFPVTTTFSKEMPTTNFSFDNSEKVTVVDSGTYVINAIADGIAQLTYTGTQIAMISAKIGDQPVRTDMKSLIKADLQIDIKTGIVISNIHAEEGTMNVGSNDAANTSTSKATGSIKINLQQ